MVWLFSCLCLIFIFLFLLVCWIWAMNHPHNTPTFYSSLSVCLTLTFLLRPFAYSLLLPLQSYCTTWTHRFSSEKPIWVFSHLFSRESKRKFLFVMSFSGMWTTMSCLHWPKFCYTLVFCGICFGFIRERRWSLKTHLVILENEWDLLLRVAWVFSRFFSNLFKLSFWFMVNGLNDLLAFGLLYVCSWIEDFIYLFFWFLKPLMVLKIMYWTETDEVRDYCKLCWFFLGWRVCGFFL